MYVYMFECVCVCVHMCICLSVCVCVCVCVSSMHTSVGEILHPDFYYFIWGTFSPFDNSTQGLYVLTFRQVTGEMLLFYSATIIEERTKFASTLARECRLLEMNKQEYQPLGKNKHGKIV